jgi:hypothetical protein
MIASVSFFSDSIKMTAKESHANFIKRTRRRMTQRLQGHAKTRRACPPGTIVRDAYVRETRRGKRTFVPASCIKDLGNPGKGLPSGNPGIGPLRKGDLAPFGYSNVKELSESRRHLALAKAVRTYGSLTVWRKVNALYIYLKNTAPVSSAIFKADRDWIKERYGIGSGF